MKKMLMCMVSVLVLISCKQQKSYDYTEIINYIIENESLFLHNGLKGIEAMNLWKEQEKFYSARVQYFLSLLKNDSSYKEVYSVKEKEYYNLFSMENKYYFYWSKDIIDFQISYRINERFGDILLPLSIIHEYFRTTPELYSKENSNS